MADVKKLMEVFECLFAFEMVWMPVREQFAYIAPSEILEPDRKT